jgi:ribose 5-phosphate isomerase B
MHITFGTDAVNGSTEAVLDHLRSVATVEVVDTREWPDVGRRVGEAVAAGRSRFGVVMCGTGTGVSIAANKVHGVRAALAWDPWVARGARLWNDANVLALSMVRLSPAVAVECVEAFLAVTDPDPGEQAHIESLESGPA